MIVRALDNLGDTKFGKGRSDYLFDIGALIQVIETRLRSHLGDCFFDEQAGIDWFNLIGSKRVEDLRLAVTAIILDTEGVQRLISLTFAMNAERQLIIRYNALSIYGEINRAFVFEG